MNVTYTFMTLGENETPQTFDTFKDAFVAMYNYVNERQRNGTLSLMFLEQCMWIKASNNSLPLPFYASVNIAYELGILVDGKLVE